MENQNLEDRQHQQSSRFIVGNSGRRFGSLLAPPAPESSRYDAILLQKESESQLEHRRLIRTKRSHVKRFAYQFPSSH